MSIKIIAVDIDGTLTDNGGGSINLTALSMLRNLTKIGYKVVLVSGRSSIEGYILAVFGGLTRIAVGENGGVITNSPSNHILLTDKSYSEKAFEILSKSIENVKIKNVFPRLTEVVLERSFDIHEGERILREHSLPVIITDSMYAYHLNYKDINKAVGFKKVLDMLGIKEEESIAIGDSETDVPLFRLCSHSIALGNASKYVKEQAMYSVKNSNGDGLIEAIEYITSNILR
ncbi:MAG: phosphoglycolate phosphatase [Candidatus Nitrosocaldaceae archaeon]